MRSNLHYMRVGIHQSYLFPYMGYFDLIRTVDKFVLYDDAKYMKGKYINRNFFPDVFTFRLKKHSDYAKINECYFHDIEADKELFLQKTKLEKSRKYLDLMRQEYDLAHNIHLTLEAICKDLGINTPFYRSSDILHRKFSDGLVDIVKHLGGDTYVNAPGGRALYNQEMFGDIKLEFIDTVPSPSVLLSKELCLI